MKDKKLFMMLLLGFAFLTSTRAQDTRPLSLKEAIELGIRNSKQLRISSAKIEEANAALKEAQERKLPDAKVTGSYMWLSNAHVDVKSSGSNGNGSNPRVSQALYGIANASLPIYSGGRIRYGIESSRFLAEAARLDAETDRDAVIMNTVAAYVNLFKARAAVDLVNENLVQARQRVTELGRLEKNGLLARNDYLKAELRASQTELTLLEAQNNWQLANLNMNIMLGFPDKTMLQPDSSLLQSGNQAPDLESLLAASAGKKEIESMGLKKQAALSGVKSVKGERYPSLALTGGYIAADIPKVLTITNAVNFGLGISYDIGALWKNRSKVQGAEARVKQIAATQELLADRVRLQVNSAYLGWLNSRKKIDVYEKAIEQASENYRIVKNKYNNSLATTTELLDADVAQLQSRMDLLFARADAVQAYHELLQSAGLTQTAIK